MAIKKTGKPSIGSKLSSEQLATEKALFIEEKFCDSVGIRLRVAHLSGIDEKSELEKRTNDYRDKRKICATFLAWFRKIKTFDEAMKIAVMVRLAHMFEECFPEDEISYFSVTGGVKAAFKSIENSEALRKKINVDKVFKSCLRDGYFYCPDKPVLLKRVGLKVSSRSEGFWAECLSLNRAEQLRRLFDGEKLSNLIDGGIEKSRGRDNENLQTSAWNRKGLRKRVIRLMEFLESASDSKRPRTRTKKEIRDKCCFDLSNLEFDIKIAATNLGASEESRVRAKDNQECIDKWIIKRFDELELRKAPLS